MGQCTRFPTMRYVRMLRSACTYTQSDQSLCSLLKYFMSVKLLTEHLLEFLSLKGGCTGLSESTLVKMPQRWKSHVTAHFKVLTFIHNLFACCVILHAFLCLFKKATTKSARVSNSLEARSGRWFVATSGKIA